MLFEKRVLVVEAEFLVALEMQHMLEKAKASKTVFARTIEEVADLGDRFGEFDLAIVEMQRDRLSSVSLCKALLEGGVAVVATTGDRNFRHDTPDPPGVPLLTKQFTEAELLTACALALAARQDISRATA